MMTLLLLCKEKKKKKEPKPLPLSHCLPFVCKESKKSFRLFSLSFSSFLELEERKKGTRGVHITHIYTHTYTHTDRQT